MYYGISLLFLGIAILVRKIKKNKSIVTYLLYIWTIVNIVEIITSLMIGSTNMDVNGLIVNIIVALCGIITARRGTVIYKTEPVVRKNLFFVLFFLFSIAALKLLMSFSTLLFTYGFNYVQILLNKKVLLPDGILAYCFLLGVPLLLFTPYIEVRKSTKIVVTVFIMMIYAVYPKRTYLFFGLFFLFYQYFLKQYIYRIPRRYYFRIFMGGIVLVALFHMTQVMQHKSVYNSWNSTGEYNHFEAAILDTTVYIDGNIGNTGEYLRLSAEKGHVYPLNNTLYAVYTILHNIGITNATPEINNFFVHNGDLSTNTINTVTYYADDAGFLYAFFLVLLIFIYLEQVSRKGTKYSNLIYPFALYNAVLFFRQNDFMLVYFIITNVVVCFPYFTFGKRTK